MSYVCFRKTYFCTNFTASQLPPLARRGLAKALILLAQSCEDQQAREAYWSRTLRPLVESFASVVGNPQHLRRVYNDDQVRTAVESLIESFIGKRSEDDVQGLKQFSVHLALCLGVAQGTQVCTAQALFSSLQPVLASAIDLLGLYHCYPSVVELVMELYCESARRMLCFLGKAHSRIMYERSIQVIQVWRHK